MRPVTTSDVFHRIPKSQFPTEKQEMTLITLAMNLLLEERGHEERSEKESCNITKFSLNFLDFLCIEFFCDSC